MSKAPTDTSPAPLNKQKLNSKLPVFTPASTPSDTPLQSTSRVRSRASRDSLIMEGEATEKLIADVETQPEGKSTSKLDSISPEKARGGTSKSTTKLRGKHDRPGKYRRTRKHHKYVSSSTSSSSSSDSEEDMSDSTSTTDTISSEDETKVGKMAKKRKSSEKKKQKKKKNKRRKDIDSDFRSEESDASDVSQSETDSSPDEKRKRKNPKAHRRTIRYDSESEDDRDHDAYDNEMDEIAQLQAQLAAMKYNMRVAEQDIMLRSRKRNAADEQHRLDMLDRLDRSNAKKKKKNKKKKSEKKASTLEYKRVDQLWDTAIHDYKITESAEGMEDEFQQYIFTVRRRFDWENKYTHTVVDIKSKLLKEVLQEVMKDVKGVSLVEDQPSIDPNMLFLYKEELQQYIKTSLKSKMKLEKKRKMRKRYKDMRSHVKVLIKYIDKDYEEIKNTLYPMLKAGNITFNLLWALFKPNTIAFTTTYGSSEHPRCFKVDYATKEANFMRGEWYCIEGRYLEYDGKVFGLGDFEVDVEMFKGPRKITSLATYPLMFHNDPETLSRQLIERGRQFVSMEGMNYRFHDGLAFMKKKKTVAKVNIHGRIMLDPATFRRINPNYPISFVKQNEADDAPKCEDSDEEDSGCGCSDSDEEEPQEGSARTTRTKLITTRDREPQVVHIPDDEHGQEIQMEKIDKLPDDTDSTIKRDFSNEELLIASPVVLGFAFNEKLWLEFSLSGVKDIKWNEGAFESLVLPSDQKTIVKALVESHKFHAAKTIDDVVQGKGKGQVFVLHGAPGLGKTLTAEGIAELLRCPLYMVSAGELGTDPRLLEQELQKILDIAHSWGAVLLLDEADVFLEKREIHDIHRNALVSIFLRLLEYFQGILFLTTNRVETFDDAFQSRIHVALRYSELTTKAKKTIWKLFLDKVHAMEDSETENNFKDTDLDILARNNMNGRQIKNAVRTAQALAVNEAQNMNMEHIKRVLQVAESFERDLKGGSGYQDAMRSYT